MNAWGFLVVLLMVSRSVFVLGGCSYLVGWHDWSEWWFVLAVLLCEFSVETKKMKADKGVQQEQA